jgi:2-haloacid dehalogenase
VIFDIGNVLYGWDPEPFYRRRLPDDRARAAFFDETGFHAWHEELDGGRCVREATADLSTRFPEYAELIAAWGANFGETISGPVPGVHRIVDDLIEADVPLFAITNFSADFWPPFHAQEVEFFSRFRDIVVSGAVKLLKPDPAIYHLALNRFALNPSEALFVDDRAVNVEGARAVGMHAHLFTDAADLRRRLEAEGLL